MIAPAAAEMTAILAGDVTARPLPVRRLSDVRPEAVEFLWHPYLPAGKLVLLAGDPGVGKSFISAALAAAISRGEGLPGFDARPPADTLILTAEDGLGDTLRPRLDRLGADASRVHATDDLLDFSEGGTLDRLRATVLSLRPALVVVDPIVSYFGGRLDWNRANQVRSVLGPLGEIAADSGACVLVVAHLSKGRAGRALHATSGSVDFGAAVRSALLAGTAGDGSEQRALCHVKSNLAAQGPSLAYSIDDGVLTWRGTSELRAADLLAGEGEPEEIAARDEAETLLAELLARGEMPASEIFAEAERQGVSRRTVQRARRRLGITTDRRGFAGGAVWRLPDHSCHSRQES